MRTVRQILCLFLVLLFAASVVTQGLQSFDMALEMASMDSTNSMPDCSGCSGSDDESDSKMTCAPLCVTTVLAVIETGESGSDVASVRPFPLPMNKGTGRTTLVDPNPPRSRVLTQRSPVVPYLGQPAPFRRERKEKIELDQLKIKKAKKNRERQKKERQKSNRV
eukprot:TRINITY_DN49588_c0_g1_i4.p2 TRINITY_DN49588_c0_g1~~TRINITY_DN49588_c0_g1_i4.p2  ORF type:complete len:165 (+),score=4.79 TRINITY_DN49588_c0_g1_i4:2-496(+)